MNPPSVDRETFLENLRRSGLFGNRELEALARRLPETDRGKALARTLVEWGVLTKFQAELLLAGRTDGFVLGQYHILDYLGQGGIGRVYKAMHRTMKRVVALKILAPQLVKTDKAHRLFKHEVRAAARLVHPNIVTAFDANKFDGRHYLVMEFVDGPNLDQLVRERGPLPVGLACELIRQAATGLQYAHEMGMVHRDVKPANLLVQRGGVGASPNLPVLKILDFGLARLHDPLATAEGQAHRTIATADNTVMGTPDYLSPEQARNLHETDIRSDLYSLGCTFYFLLTAKVPFPGGTSLEKLIRHTKDEPVPVEQLRPDLPVLVSEIVHKLMAKKPEDRYQTPAEAADAVAPFASTAPASGVGLGRPGSTLSGAGGSGADSSAIELDAAPVAGGLQSGVEGTWPPDLSPTPLSAKAIPQLVPGTSRRRTVWKAIAFLVTIAVVAAVAGVIGYLLARP